MTPEGLDILDSLHLSLLQTEIIQALVNGEAREAHARGQLDKEESVLGWLRENGHNTITNDLRSELDIPF